MAEREHPGSYSFLCRPHPSPGLRSRSPWWRHGHGSLNDMVSVVLCARNLLEILPLEVAGNLPPGMPVEATHREWPFTQNLQWTKLEMPGELLAAECCRLPCAAEPGATEAMWWEAHQNPEEETPSSPACLLSKIHTSSAGKELAQLRGNTLITVTVICHMVECVSFTSSPLLNRSVTLILLLPLFLLTIPAMSSCTSFFNPFPVSPSVVH